MTRKLNSQFKSRTGRSLFGLDFVGAFSDEGFFPRAALRYQNKLVFPQIWVSFNEYSPWRIHGSQAEWKRMYYIVCQAFDGDYISHNTQGNTDQSLQTQGRLGLHHCFFALCALLRDLQVNLGPHTRWPKLVSLCWRIPAWFGCNFACWDISNCRTEGSWEWFLACFFPFLLFYNCNLLTGGRALKKSYVSWIPMTRLTSASASQDSWAEIQLWLGILSCHSKSSLS